MSAAASEIAALLRRDLLRLRQQVEAFADEAQLWQVLPGVDNSAATLALHLEGNLREYIGRQLGGIAYVRDRPLEFAGRNIAKADLLARIENLVETIPAVAGQLTDEALSQRYPEDVLGTQLSTRQFVMHLIGHLNYHLGQIDYLRRVLTAGAAIHYAGLQ